MCGGVPGVAPYFETDTEQCLLIAICKVPRKASILCVRRAAVVLKSAPFPYKRYILASAARSSPLPFERLKPRT